MNFRWEEPSLGPTVSLRVEADERDGINQNMKETAFCGREDCSEEAEVRPQAETQVTSWRKERLTGQRRAAQRGQERNVPQGGGRGTELDGRGV